jgi:nitrate/nitrite-specific signal transduction histidine kinase
VIFEKNLVETSLSHFVATLQQFVAKLENVDEHCIILLEFLLKHNGDEFC